MNDMPTNTVSLRDSAVVSLDIVGPFVTVLFSNGQTVALATSLLKRIATENALDGFGRHHES